MTGDCRRERTSRAMRGIRALPFRLEDFLLGTAFGGKAQQVDRLVKMATCDNHRRRTHLMELGCRRPHFVQIVTFSP